ncbi:hypothetical protein M758_5G119200 [Ceratodon purpureus]|nr:hypothetical protein M758_5G119200 [Ceratodon purpureus]
MAKLEATKDPGAGAVADTHSSDQHTIKPGQDFNLLFISKEAIKNDAWQWPIYDQSRIYPSNKIKRKLRAAGIETSDKPTDAPFEITFEEDGPMPGTVAIKLNSNDLIQVAHKCLPTHESLCTEKPKVYANDMFIALKAFKDALHSIQQDLDHESKAQYWELKHLLRFLETHYKDTTAHVERMRREKKVSFDLLWAFFFKGERVHYTCNMTGRTLHGVVTLAHYWEDKRDDKLFVVKLDCHDYDGWKYVKGFVEFPVDKFNGEKTVDSIGIGPMLFLEISKVAEMDAMFLRNGKRFYDIVTKGSTFMQYVGPRIHKEHDYLGRAFSSRLRFKLKKRKADGRVMVDLLSFARMNPDFPLDNAKPPTDRTDHQTVPFRNEQETPTDEELMLAPAVVYGFSFSNKQWGGFDINGLSEVHFDDQAFDRDLVLTDPDKKEMLLALVTQYLKDPSADDSMALKIDPISNKGDGCIFLCYGPPGTGKTLTAESIAEKLHRPLWSVSVFELGVKPKDLEKKLTMILDIASQWRAVLLLDEADVYLKKRTTNADPTQMAMTAIFLRLLEYYRGVLFLTTNRVASFDDAFCSRISMFLRYHHLTVAQREEVWRNLLLRAQIKNPINLSVLREYELNGREIRNCICIAQTWARSAAKELTIDYVLKVVKMLGEYRQDLDSAIMEETEPSRSGTRAVAEAVDMQIASRNTPNDTNGSSA